MNEEKKPRLLVVDDEPDLLELYAKRLSRSGFEVISAENGQVAIDFLEKEKFDAIVCDINMPVKNGFDVFEFMRNHIKPPTPFIFVTGHGEGTPEMKTALSLGADAVYSKPVSSKILVERITELNKGNI